MKTVLITLLALAATVSAQVCDLTLSGGTTSPNPCALTSTLTVQLTVHNNAATSCQDVAVEFFLSSDSLLDGSDCSLGATALTVAPGANATATRTLAPLSSVACVSRGRFYLLAQEHSANRLRLFPTRLVVWPSLGSYACTGIGVLNNPQSHVDAYFGGSNYILKDYSRRAGNDIHGHHGQMNTTASIWAQAEVNGSDIEVRDTDGNYDSLAQRPGVDAVVYGGLTYDYMLYVLGRNGPDGNLAQSEPNRMLMYVDATDAYNGAHNHVSAPWSSGYVCFGAHDNLRMSMAGAIEIVGHEWGHTITGFESDLTYYAESGSLNDSWSDMLGIAIAFWSGVDPDWQDGEDVWANGNPLRDLENPTGLWDDRHEGGYFPDTYHGPGWYYGEEDGQGIHHNGTVTGHMFYLLAEGGQLNGITVPGIGLDTAMTILYHANRDFWTEATDFAAGREGCISAAAEMDSLYALAVMDAWAAVGVGAPAPRITPPTRFTIRPASNGSDLQLRWSPGVGALSYRIFAGDSTRFPLDPAHFIAATADTQYVHPSAITAERRFYQVIASTVAP